MEYLDFIKNSKYTSNELDKIFKKVDPDMLSLLKGLLEFNPVFRLTAKEALKSKIFDKIRVPFFEKPSSIFIESSVDQPGMFCYETAEGFLSISQYKQIL